MGNVEELKARLHSVWNLPHNQICCDCGDKKPTWASIIVTPPNVSEAEGDNSMGAFCCFHCSGAHRRLGVHICFVRSITLDEWKEKEVEAMERGGNDRINKAFEASIEDQRGLKPTAKSDLETRDKFVKAKYRARDYFDPTCYKPAKIEQNPLFDSAIFHGMSDENLFSESKKDLYGSFSAKLHDSKSISRPQQHGQNEEDTTRLSAEDLFSASKQDMIHHFMNSPTAAPTATTKQERSLGISRIDTMVPGGSASLRDDEDIPPPFSTQPPRIEDFEEEEIVRLGDRVVGDSSNLKGGKSNSQQSRSRRSRGSKSPVHDSSVRRSRVSKSPIHESSVRRRGSKSPSGTGSRRSRLARVRSVGDLDGSRHKRPTSRSRRSHSKQQAAARSSARRSRESTPESADRENGNPMPSISMRKSTSTDLLSGRSRERPSIRKRHSERNLSTSRSEDSLLPTRRKKTSQGSSGNATFDLQERASRGGLSKIPNEIAPLPPRVQNDTQQVRSSTRSQSPSQPRSSRNAASGLGGKEDRRRERFESRLQRRASERALTSRAAFRLGKTDKQSLDSRSEHIRSSKVKNKNDALSKSTHLPKSRSQGSKQRVNKQDPLAVSEHHGRHQYMSRRKPDELSRSEHIERRTIR